MDFEARLDRIGERVDGLAQSMELLVAMHRDNEQRLAKFVEETDRRHEQSQQRAVQMMDAINRLAHIAEIHEQRIDDLEN